jgi:hypothetical protein
MPRGVYQRTDTHKAILTRQIAQHRLEYSPEVREFCINKVLAGETVLQVAVFELSLTGN